MRVFIAIPAYSGSVSVETARSLLNEQTVLLAAGHDVKALFLPGCSLITMARNQLVDDFLRSGDDRMVFIDADLSWEPGAIQRLIGHDVPCVGGAYRFKQDEENYPVAWAEPPEEDKRRYAEIGLMMVDGLPGGFMALRRDAFDAFRLLHGNRTYGHFGRGAYAYFTAPFRDGRLMGEDNAFCADLQAAGVPVLLDPSLTITHHDGPNAYTGCVGDWLKARLQLKPAVAAE